MLAHVLLLNPKAVGKEESPEPIKEPQRVKKVTCSVGSRTSLAKQP